MADKSWRVVWVGKSFHQGIFPMGFWVYNAQNFLKPVKTEVLKSMIFFLRVSEKIFKITILKSVLRMTFF